MTLVSSEESTRINALLSHKIEITGIFLKCLQCNAIIFWQIFGVAVHVVVTISPPPNAQIWQSVSHGFSCNVSHHTAKTAQDWFKNHQKKHPKLPNSLDSNPIIHQWDAPEQASSREVPPVQPSEPRGSALNTLLPDSTPEGRFPCANRSELF